MSPIISGLIMTYPFQLYIGVTNFAHCFMMILNWNWSDWIGSYPGVKLDPLIRVDGCLVISEFIYSVYV